MNLKPASMATREKLMLAGLFLAKYDGVGLKRLGFDGFVEAFNIVGYALGGNPASVKNYRDEFDPFFPNPRMGWHKRPLREHCQKILETYKDLDLETFSCLIGSFVGYDENVQSSEEPDPLHKVSASSFAKRVATGLAAEHYFESIQPTLPQFEGYSLENTTRLGCGYDFRLKSTSAQDFLAVEVKGLQESTGSLSLTPKEYETAGSLSDRYFLFVVKNFREEPFHDIYQNPLAAKLRFARKERVVIQVSWQTAI